MVEQRKINSKTGRKDSQINSTAKSKHRNTSRMKGYKARAISLVPQGGCPPEWPTGKWVGGRPHTRLVA
jgi:hypothetical protein